MKREPIHLVDEPKNTRAIRTACGREIGNPARVLTSAKRKLVTCANCQRQPKGWRGLRGYSYEPETKTMLRVRVVGFADAIAGLSKMVQAAERVLDVVTTVEGRCMAADGPVTPTLREMREDELRVLWRAAKVIATTPMPELVAAGSDEKDAPRLSYAPEPARAPAGAPLKRIEPPMPHESRRERIARVQRRRKARRKSR